MQSLMATLTPVASFAFWTAQLKRITKCSTCNHSLASHYNKIGHCQKCDSCEGFEGTYDATTAAYYQEQALIALERESA